MTHTTNQVVFRNDDYNLLTAYLNDHKVKNTIDPKSAESLMAEMKKAKIVSKSNFPPDVVRLNSIIKIQTEGKNEIRELVLVAPGKANISEKKISVMSPIGAALVGFREGQQVKWQVPYGKRVFTILEVINEED